MDNMTNDGLYQEEKQTKTRLMTWNVFGVRRDLKWRTPLIAECILEQAADIVCLQEVFEPAMQTCIDTVLTTQEVKYEVFQPHIFVHQKGLTSAVRGALSQTAQNSQEKREYPMSGYVPAIAVNICTNLVIMLLEASNLLSISRWQSILLLLLFNFVVTPLLLPISIRVVYETLFAWKSRASRKTSVCFNYTGLRTYIRSDIAMFTRVVHSEVYPESLRLQSPPPFSASTPWGYPRVLGQWWVSSTFLQSSFFVTRVHFEQDDRQDLLVVNTHFVSGHWDKAKKARLRQSGYLLMRLKQLQIAYPGHGVVLCGDFNEDTTELGIQKLILAGYRGVGTFTPAPRVSSARRAGPSAGRAGPSAGRAGPSAGRAGPSAGRAGPNTPSVASVASVASVEHDKQEKKTLYNAWFGFCLGKGGHNLINPTYAIQVDATEEFMCDGEPGVDDHKDTESFLGDEEKYSLNHTEIGCGTYDPVYNKYARKSNCTQTTGEFRLDHVFFISGRPTDFPLILKGWRACDVRPHLSDHYAIVVEIPNQEIL
jgi:endonuclease/exonuclease/phosphatase family metal-dependent hydrolase